MSTSRGSSAKPHGTSARALTQRANVNRKRQCSPHSKFEPRGLRRPYNRTVTLSPDELRRYSRHLVLPQVGREGQERLRASSVLLVGAGGLGSPMALYLAAAGIGRIGIIDFDVVDETNLQRQIVHDTASIGESKVRSAAKRINELNSHVVVEGIEERLAAANARELIARYDIVADGSDNFATRYIVNDAAVLEGKPNVHGAVFRFEGQVTVFDPHRGAPCYRCLFPDPPPPGSVASCEEGGVLGILPGIIGTLQATEVLKLALGIGETLRGRLLLFDALSMKFREIAVVRNAGCPLCGARATITAPSDLADACATGEEKMSKEEITPQELHDAMQRGATYRLLDVREQNEWDYVHIDGATLIPLGALQSRFGELDPATPTVVYCRSGQRSARAAQFLRQRGFAEVLNLVGGINRWAKEVDRSLPTY